MQYWYPPTTTSKLQVNYRTTITENHLKSSWTEILSLRIYRRSHIETGRNDGDTNRTGPASTGAAEILEDYSAAKVPLRIMGSQSQDGLPSPEHQSWEEIPT